MLQENELVGKVVLVTGASGFLGSRTVTMLSAHGCFVHALVRTSSQVDRLRLPNVTIFRGDVGDAESLKAPFEGVDYVIHAAADTRGSKDAGKLSTIQGTANILTLCERYHVKKLIYISSCNVYGVADYPQGELVTEDSSLERFSEKRGAYTDAKFKAEQLVTRIMQKGTVPIVCLRPGTIYGPGGDVYTPMLGLSFGSKLFAVIGDGYLVLPLVYVDNMVEAIFIAMTNQKSTNKTYNVIDPQKVTKKEYMARLVNKLYPGSLTIYVPLGVLKLIVFFQEKLFELMKRQPVLTIYRLISSQNPIVYDASKISRELGWKPAVTAETACDIIIEHERGKG